MAGASKSPEPPAPPQTNELPHNCTPQRRINHFWARFVSRRPGRVTSIFPTPLFEHLLPHALNDDTTTTSHSVRLGAQNAADSYEAAARECRERVSRIRRECERTNEKFTDPDFDIEADRELGLKNCLHGLLHNTPWNDLFGDSSSSASSPLSTARRPLNPHAVPNVGQQKKIGDPEDVTVGSIHRVDWVFDNPRFTIDGYSALDIKQGSTGDCWWLAAVATIADRPDLMDRVCVERDETCGVYGFVFQRDGEWVSTVVDDNLYLREADFFDYHDDRYDSTGRRAREHRKQLQTGSDALCFARCAHRDETWLPLLEKAYAKVHGDYGAISGGWSGEAVEDMTGGVTTTVTTNRVLHKDRLWAELENGKDFVFALSALGSGMNDKRGGLALGHAYSVLRATEQSSEDGKSSVRLVQIRNPWGERSSSGVGEWNGPWSDGSSMWTPYWLSRIGHKFGDDGLFWMSFDDVLETFPFVHRTRLFDSRWTVVQRWAMVSVPWVASGYVRTLFAVTVQSSGQVVIVLTQLDSRYFKGLEGQYRFALHFLLRKVGEVEDEKGGKQHDKHEQEHEHICLVRPAHSWENRSVSAEVDLDAGVYEVLPKVMASRDASYPHAEEVIARCVQDNPQKLRQVGFQYDRAHAKDGITLEDEDIERKRQASVAKRRRERERKRQQTEKQKAGRRKKREKKRRKKQKEKDRKRRKKAESKERGEQQANEKKTTVNASNVGGAGGKGDTDGKKAVVADPAPPEAEAGMAEKNTDNDKSTDNKSTEENKQITNDDNKNSDNDSDSDSDSDSDEESVSASELDESEKEDEDERDDVAEDKDAEPNNSAEAFKRWNAVCMIGLRVYAKDPKVSVIVKNRDELKSSAKKAEDAAAGPKGKEGPE